MSTMPKNTNESTVVIEDKAGLALRTIRYSGGPVHLVKRIDGRRLDVVSDLEPLDRHKVKYQLLRTVDNEADLLSGIELPREHRLRLIMNEPHVPVAAPFEKEQDRFFGRLLIVLFILGLLGQWALHFAPPPPSTAKEDLVQRMVKIVKQKPPEKRVIQEANVAEVKPTRMKASLKRMGALAVLGSLSKSNQKGGLDLGAVQTSRGIGMGGTQGSGGVQTSIYGKGLVAQPLGAGNNIRGAGGYGTKGKGGGQAGYGTLSLIGSAGTEAMGLERDAVVDGGLDRDMIFEVVRRNQGQVRFCYEQGLQSDPKLAGRVAVKWVIDGNGQVKVAGIESTTINSKVIEDCILARLKSWKFPLPQGGVDVSVSFPFMLNRRG